MPSLASTSFFPLCTVPPTFMAEAEARLTASSSSPRQIPNPVLSGRGKCEKLTKINILHVTINYIRAMENLLTTGDSGVNSYSEMVRNPIRPDEAGGKHKKFESCDAAAASPAADRASTAIRVPKKAKNGGAGSGEIRDDGRQSLLNAF